MTAQTEQQLPAVVLTGLLAAAFLPRAIQVAARLGLGGILRRGPADVSEIANEAAADPDALARVLRLLAEHDVVRELDDGRFAPTALSDHLHLIDHAGSGDENWHTWGGLLGAVRCGRPAFEKVHGTSFFQFIGRDPQREANWNDWNTVTGESWLPPIVDALQLAGTETVVDVGGGQGNLLAEILSCFPRCRGVLLDLPSVVAAAPNVLERRGVRSRCEMVAGDAFDRVPSGGDVYSLCRVLFNWDREHRVRLLRRCREVMRDGSRLLVVEMLMPEKGDPTRKRITRIDLNLWLTWGGSIPTREEWEGLFVQAGFSLLRVSPPPSPVFPWRVFEGSPK